MKRILLFSLLLCSVALGQNFNLSPNMSLPIPVVGVDPGPDWASNLNSSLTIVDGHNHTPGSGVQVPTSGLNINADLPFANNQATGLKATVYQSQVSLSTLQAAYVKGVDLYYRDGSGNEIRITASGAIAGTPGSISGLVSPASATYNPGTGTFIWQSNTNTAANMDFASAVLRKTTASSNGITLSVPSSLASNYTITLPALPGTQNIMTLDASGNMAAPWNVDNSTIDIAANNLEVKDGGITTAKLATAVSQGLVPTGAITAFGGTAAPSGYVLCDGTSYTRTGATAALFAVIGTAYGAADGSHFNVPDLRGKFERGVSGSTSNDPDKATRTACATGGATADNVGSCQGFAMQSHQHAFLVYDGSGAGDHAFTTALASIEGTEITSDAQTISGNPTVILSVNETRSINVYVNYIIKL